jgi:tetratricopeptide (TPR) repeat protein
MGREREAIPFYERAIREGLSGNDLEGAYLGLGSSYRCVGRARKAAAVLRRGSARFPASRGLKVFLAMALHRQSRHDEAFSGVLRLLAETTADRGISRYRRALAGYAAEFVSRSRRA